MNSELAERRFRTIHNHLIITSTAGDHDQQSLFHRENAASKFFYEQGFSNALPEELKTGKWNVYRSARSPLKLVSRFADHPEIGTLHDNFVRSVKKFPDCKYLGSRVREDGTVGEYKWITYGEAGTARSAIGSALVFRQIPKGCCVGLYFINRPEWLIVDHACSAYSYISVPLYDTLGPEAVKYIANHAAIGAIFCVPETLNHLLSFLSEIPSLHLIVGLSNLQPFCTPKPEDVATICYTSGTTGTPKGAVLTHGNLIANVAGTSFGITLYSSDIYISYLPLAHIFERATQVLLVYFGGASGFYQGDNLKLVDDMAVLRPTVFCSVPRLYNRIYSGIMNVVKTSGSLRERIFNAAYNAKKQAIFNGKNSFSIWDRLVFNKIKARLGGRVRYMVSGASPLSPDVMDFLRVCFGCQVVEGYGMTETSCVISNMDQNDILSGHVGSPNPACEIKLVDVPEMNYTSEDQPYPRGEICVRGPIVFQGYYKDEAQTQEVIDKDGWLHTGDIGLWLPGGRLKIIDRKKNIFKLAQGEYVAPEKIENVYAKSKYVTQCFIHGDSLNASLVGIVCVDPDMLKAWAMNEGIKNKDMKQLCTDPRAKAAVLKDMDTVGKEAQLRGFEFARAITLVLEPFAMENDLLTPTFKIKRPQARAYFAKEIADMYAELPASNFFSR
ncbi:long chain acyl-CoA synthetase 6, peroxisomal-like isoform X3 [Lycium barbarum]|uniref:long chain acyl-CoA synthetase 6, peroxisomal-like isoform X3 n=1 Tax=Lycium barbarum TaxID=112863 RepID=UPI00293F53A0|nr:long chain acyl-CoA synthetase 6, peroxisomal-like isoform X3 [Lycium barbarum]